MCTYINNISIYSSVHGLTRCMYVYIYIYIYISNISIYSFIHGTQHDHLPSHRCGYIYISTMCASIHISIHLSMQYIYLIYTYGCTYTYNTAPTARSYVCKYMGTYILIYIMLDR